ncbi:MAG: peptide deformylase [Candidatus Doudnabacteria bacterium RIFCSPHIGHO2_01_FULL_45_18]|uniref:Peptide deformylase n=1 Tax=Candidatus Doudnabacteria bacterium RIFCSPHIGHO2_01_FULL_45_18 TaxID=1817823 RepID=A0A1F5NR87_9BACT|nr:MAG: peptide deformylase [Candidatus Doudnabacteria bacterium RIFCSPHIGHO2_01_FULL_45_18]
MLKIVTVPNSILTKKTEPIKVIDQDLKKLVTQMIESCRNANGIGLAAPQIGKSIRLCIINLEHLGLPAFALVNPKIVKKSWKKLEMEEGCLSIPGVFGIVRRPAKITVAAQNLHGEIRKFPAHGLLARVIQHEVDHLDGILFTSKISRRTDGAETTRRKLLE